MSVRETVPILVETTDAVEQKHAFDYWRSTVLARVDATPLAPDVPFAAGRRLAITRHGAVLHTLSNPIGVERTAQHVRRDGQDDIAIVLLLQGSGYVEQGNGGALLSAGDVTVHAMDQPFAIGSRDSYEEIRLQVPRAAFLSQVGSVQAFAGRRLRATPLSGLFATYLRSFSETIGGLSEAEARTRAGDLLARLNLPERLWGLPPATFSGGEQQRVNIAMGLIAPRPILLLDEPTASLDAPNRAVVAELVCERRAAGAAILGIVHDAAMREAIGGRIIDVTRFGAARAA